MGSIGSGRALEGAIVYRHGQHGQQKIGLVLPAGMKRVRWLLTLPSTLPTEYLEE